MTCLCWCSCSDACDQLGRDRNGKCGLTALHPLFLLVQYNDISKWNLTAEEKQHLLVSGAPPCSC